MQIPEKWNEENYKKFIKYLISIQDLKYKEFHSSLVLNSKYEIIGIRLPVMRNIAKEIAKSNIEEFLEYAQDKYYEEVMIQGLIISHIKDEKMFYKHFIEFIKAFSLAIPFPAISKPVPCPGDTLIKGKPKVIFVQPK